MKNGHEVSVMFSRKLRAWAEKDGRGYPDWTLRYVPIVKPLGRERLDAGAILKIGANENGLSRFANVPIIAVGFERSHLETCRSTQHITPVVADISALALRDDTFSVCVSVDTSNRSPKRFATQPCPKSREYPSKTAQW